MTDEPRNLKELPRWHPKPFDEGRHIRATMIQVENGKFIHVDDIEALLRCRIEALIPIAERQEKKNVFLRNRNQNEDENWARERIAELEGLLGTKDGREK